MRVLIWNALGVQIPLHGRDENEVRRPHG